MIKEGRGCLSSYISYTANSTLTDRNLPLIFHTLDRRSSSIHWHLWHPSGSRHQMIVLWGVSVLFVCFLGDGVYEDQIAGYEDGCRGQAGGDMGEVGLVPGGVEEPADQEHGEDSQP